MKRTDAVDIVTKLERHGITATPEQSIEDLAARNDVDEFHLLGLVFLDDRQDARR